MKVSETVHEIPWLVSADLSDHHGEERVGSDVERNTEEEVGTPLVKLAAQARAFGFGIMDVELKKEVARWKGHLVNLADVPGRNEMASGRGVILEAFDQFGDLVHAGSILLRPGAPLLTIDGSKISVLISPFVPDSNLVLLEVGDVCVPFEEP